MVDLDDPVSEISDTIELDEYQQQELDEIANLNKNFDIFGTDLDTVSMVTGNNVDLRICDCLRKQSNQQAEVL